MPQGIRGVLEELLAAATDEQDKGAKFERLMQAYHPVQDPEKNLNSTLREAWRARSTG